MSPARWEHCFCGEARAAPNPEGHRFPTTAEQLVADARQAKLVGDTTRYFSLLRKAVQIAPDYELARWQLGQLKDRWRVGCSRGGAATRGRQSEAGSIPRASHTAWRDARGSASLARWCRKNDLDDEAKFHWASVLSVDPTNEEALRGLNMRWHDGRLLTREQIAQQKGRLREAKENRTSVGSRKSAKWRRAIGGGDPTERRPPWRDVRAITTRSDPRAWRQFTLGTRRRRENVEECRDVSSRLLEALYKMRIRRQQNRWSVMPCSRRFREVRTTAIEKLKPRPQHDYRAAPLERTGHADRVVVQCSYRRRWQRALRAFALSRGAESDWELDARFATLQHVIKVEDLYTPTINVIEDQTGSKT